MHLAQLKKYIHKRELYNFSVVIGTALIIGVMGIIPHIVFSINMGEVSYFKSAYDEEYYILQAIDLGSRPDRLISAVLVKIIYLLAGKNVENTLIIADFIFPFFCYIAAFFLASVIVSGALQRILLALLFLFGQEFLSLGSSAIWNDQTTMWNLNFWRSQFGSWGEIIIPYYSTAYFSLFRSPEPQVSWIVLFGYLGFFVKYFVNQRHVALRWTGILSLFLLDTLLAFTYIFIALSVEIIKFIFAICLWFVGNKKESIYISSSCLYWFIITLTIYLTDLNEAISSTSFVFHSRLPIVTPSVLLSLLMIFIAINFIKKINKNDYKLFFSLVTLTIPVILTNQQILTGMMISAKEWERYVNYPFLFLGTALLFVSTIHFKRREIAVIFQKIIPLSLVLFLFYLLFIGQLNTWDHWYRLNELVTAQKRTLLEVIEEFPFNQLKVLMEKPGREPLLGLRLNNNKYEISFIVNYNKIFVNPIADMPAQGGLPHNQSERRYNLFEFFARTAKTPAEVFNILKNEAMQKAGFHLAFLFSFNDYWFPATDSRLVRQNAILANLDLIVSDYTEYLQEPKASWFDTTILLSEKAPEELGANQIWSNRLLSEGIAGQSKVYAYVQEVKPNWQSLKQ